MAVPDGQHYYGICESCKPKKITQMQVGHNKCEPCKIEDRKSDFSTAFAEKRRRRPGERQKELELAKAEKEHLLKEANKNRRNHFTGAKKPKMVKINQERKITNYMEKNLGGIAVGRKKGPKE